MSLQVVEQQPTISDTQLTLLQDRLTEIIVVLAERYTQGIYYTKDLDPEIDNIHNQIRGG